MFNSAAPNPWGMLASSEGYGKPGDSKEDFQVIACDDAKSEVYASHKHAVHGMLFARNDSVLWDLYSSRAAILMQMRFDGLLGFPGGLVDPGEDPLTGLRRELHEEIGLDLERHNFTDEHHLISYLHEKKQLVLHFYALEVTLKDFRLIEAQVLQAPEYGDETMGIIRPPLYTMGDNVRGLPAFLSNQFAGNAKEELVYALTHFKLLSEQEMDTALAASAIFKSSLR